MKVLSRILLLIAFFACVLPLHPDGCIDSLRILRSCWRSLVELAR